MIPEQDTHLRDNRMRARWTLWLALLGGNLCGLASDYPALTRVLSHRPATSGQTTGLEVAGFLLGSLLLPAVVTGFAPRRSFLWGPSRSA